MPVDRIDAATARSEVRAGRALLVCAYADEAKCGTMMLESAMTLGQLEAQRAALPKSRAIVFY